MNYIPSLLTFSGFIWVGYIYRTEIPWGQCGLSIILFNLVFAGLLVYGGKTDSQMM